MPKNKFTFVSTSAKASPRIWSKIPFDFNSSTRVLTKFGSLNEGGFTVESVGFESIFNHLIIHSEIQKIFVVFFCFHEKISDEADDDSSSFNDNRL